MLNFTSKEEMAIEKLLKAVEKVAEENVLVLLLNPEMRMINCDKEQMMASKVLVTTRMVAVTRTLDRDLARLQVAADSVSLVAFLKVSTTRFHQM